MAPWDIPEDEDNNTFPENAVLTPEVQEWLGLDSNPVLSDEKSCECGECDSKTTATWANDEMDWTFEMIADALESRYLTEEIPA
jgi:hypothetical protein